MSSIYTVKFYGSNTDIVDNRKRTVKYPLISEVTALTDVVVTREYEASGLYADLEIETETKTFWNGAKLMVNNALDIWDIQILPIEFPKTNINAYELYSKEFINKKYKWLDITTYPIRPYELINTFNKLIAVNLISRKNDSNNGFKELGFTFQERF